MINKKYSEMVLGLIMLVSGLIYFILSGTIPKKTFAGTVVNAATVPYVLASMLIILGLLQTGMGLLVFKHEDKKEEKKEEVADDASEEKPSYLTVLQTLVVITIYTFFIAKIGFLIMTILCLFVLFIILTPVDQKKNYLRYGIISIISACFIYFSFRNGLHLMLPEGLLKYRG